MPQSYQPEFLDYRTAVAHKSERFTMCERSKGLLDGQSG